jgi:phosphatidylglycerol:prolipoprotein diacylglycerol transferase
MTEPVRLFSLIGMDVYPYGLCVAAAALLACALLCALAKGRFGDTAEGLRLALWLLPVGLLFSRLFYLLIRLRFIVVDYAPDFWYSAWLGGYSLAGASVGSVLGALFYARTSGRNVADALDIATPPALLLLAGVRLAEVFTLDGVGLYVENEALWRFPFAVPNSYGEYVMPVFAYEAVAALLLCAGLLCWMRRAGRRRGDAVLMAMLLAGLSQVLLESLRADDFLRFGFVRVNQLWGVLLAGVALFGWLARSRPSRGRVSAVVAAFVICVLVLVACEFGLDKSAIPNGILYGAMAAVLLAIGVLALRLRAAGERRVGRGA